MLIRKSLLNKSAKFGRRSSLTTQLYIQNSPKHLMLSESDYLVPQLDEKINFADLNKDLRQKDLEKSWKSLNKFQQTHKGRLDSAKNAVPDPTSGM